MPEMGNGSERGVFFAWFSLAFRSSELTWQTPACGLTPSS
jgi:hypothetical protein